ncbi:hypothetical protein DNTS_009819 [Danionella cerebrum]|uniref:C2H2-type domain-containing protein n=1 Tax=Danionella cerebrum TaxID=2873325 RepID=A0A553MXM3_9TELE|nr:hypothetical protein DNTS_009819 [Danionella translucida]
MLSDELESKPELLVEFVQNASIPLGQSLEEADSKQRNILSPLEQPESHVASPSLSELVPERSSLVLELQTHTSPPSRAQSPSILQELQNGLAASADPLVFIQDETDADGDGLSVDGSAPWFLRVQELAHDSLIAATRAQLREHIQSCPSEPQKKDPGVHPSEKIHRCPYESCCRTFTYPAHLKYHLKTHRNERSFRCVFEGCGKSFYVLQRLQVHMRTHTQEKPFICHEEACGKSFSTAGNLKNHQRIHTGEKPFVCDVQRCGRSFAEYSSLRKHVLVHSGEKPHVCSVCGKSFSQSGSRNVHMKKRHGQPSTEPLESSGEALTQSSLLESAAAHPLISISLNPQHHQMLPTPGSTAEDPGLGLAPPPTDLVAMTTAHTYSDDVTLL